MKLFQKQNNYKIIESYILIDLIDLFLQNFSKNYLLNQKICFGIGAAIASFLFFFTLGYLSNYLSKYANSKKIWKVINIFIICIMSILILFIIKEILNIFM